MKKFLIVFGLVVVCSVLILIIAKKPSTGKIVNKNTLPSPTSKSTEKEYDSDYVHFKYKSDYDLSHIETTDGRVLENIKILGGSGSSLTMVITLSELSQELSDISAVQMRRANSWQYSEDIARMGDLRGLLFRTADKKEKTAFFKKNNGILTVSMTTNSNDPAYDKDFFEFLDNFQWK